jgi:hypothetical protein
MQSGRMQGLADYKNVLTIGVSQQGWYLASMFFFRFMHPPLLVPWNEIKVRRSTGWLGLRICNLDYGTRSGNPSADSREARGEVTGVG